MTIARPRRARGTLPGWLVCLVLMAPGAARAAPVCGRPVAVRSADRGWAAPLDRQITLHARDVALGEALDRVAAAAHLRLSYSPDGLGLERRVCVAYDSIAAGDVLSDLLAGSTLVPVAAGGDQVVLAPVAALHAVEHAQRSVNVLEGVVVTEAARRTASLGVATSDEIVTHDELVRRGGGAISQTINGAVPGVWVWDQSPASLVARYGSLRGASSFRSSYPKVYIDGVELANPLLFTELSSDAVERVDVIRGPQGGALYGADAIGGVIDVVMRHDPGSGDGLARVRTTAGVAHSTFADHPVLSQEHGIDLRGGSDARSSSMSVVLGETGSYVPGAQSWDARADAGFRLLGASTMLTGMGRFYAKDAGMGINPLLGSSAVRGTQSLREYTLGTTATLATSERWTHALTVGVDAYRLSGGPASGAAPMPSAIDSALLAARGSAERATLRASSIGRLGAAGSIQATATLAAEHSTIWRQPDVAPGFPLGNRRGADGGAQSATGVAGKLDVTWRDALFVTGGLRLEDFAGVAATDGLVSLPTVGAAVVHRFGGATAKLRASYGRAIRSPAAAVGASWIAQEATVPRRLPPEEQSGFESGVDVFFGSRLALRVTHFDQHAYSLVQPVAIVSSPANPNNSFGSRLLYSLQNVGEIANRGWELESSLTSGRLTLTGTMSLVDSRVARLADGYGGDLRAGDRMLAVPSGSAGLTSAWSASRWSASLTATRVADWVNYDGLALANASAIASRPIVGDDLRTFWRAYSGVTRIDASATRDLSRRITLVVAAHNLLDTQRGEPDNVTVVPGRTVTAGVRATF